MKKPLRLVIFSIFFILIIDAPISFSREQEKTDLRYFALADSSFTRGHMDSAILYFQKILDQDKLDEVTLGKVKARLSLVYRRKGNHEKALSYGKEAWEHYKTANDSLGMAGATIALAKVFNATGDNKTAMDYYFQLLPFVERWNDTLKQGQIYALIANVYMDIDRIDKGIEYYKKSIDVLTFMGDESFYADELNNLGIAFYDKGQYDSALLYYNKSMHAFQKKGAQDAIGASIQNIGITLVKTGRSTEGLNALRRAYRIFKDLKLERDKLSVLTDLGTAFIETGERDSAEYYLYQALQLADKLKHSYYKKVVLWNLYDLYNTQKMPQKALQAFRNYSNYKDSIDNMEMKQSLIEMETKYKTAEREKEIQQLKYQKKIADANLRLLLIGITTLAIIVILIIRMLILKRRKDRQIHQQKMLVYEQEKKLTEVELAEHAAREKLMEEELEFKTRQLASHAMNMMQKNSLLQEVTEIISERIKTLDDKGKAGLRMILIKLEQGLNADKDWELFKMYFEQINKDFFIKLKQINPNLTTHDYRLAALVKLNLSIKETASVLNISPDSLKNARYRLKKKLHLPDNLKLGEMIRNL